MAVPVQTRLQSEQEARLALITFESTISAGEVRPGRVHADDREIEGDFWFAKITSEMFMAPEGGFVFAGEEFATEFLLVKIQWFQALTPLSESQSRVYKLLSDERCLSVMAVMRIDSVEVTQLTWAGTIESIRIVKS